MKHIDPNENKIFYGPVKEISSNYLVQQAGRDKNNDLCAHILILLDYEPSSYRPIIGDSIEIKYRNGRGLVKAPKGYEPAEKERELALTPHLKKKIGHER